MPTKSTKSIVEALRMFKKVFFDNKDGSKLCFLRF